MTTSPRLNVPDDLDFEQLGLEIEPRTGRLLFLPVPLSRLCATNGLDAAQVLASEDMSCSLICQWYEQHRLSGGAADHAVEAVLRKIAREDVRMRRIR